jgi:hypothetical protein
MKRWIALILIMSLMLSFSMVVFGETYYIQVGAFKYQSNADKYVDYLVSSVGVKAVAINVNGLYKVFLGPFETIDEAREAESIYEGTGESGFLVLESKMYDVIPPKEPVVDEAPEDEADSTDQDSSEDDTSEDSTEESTEESTDEDTADEDTADEDSTDSDTTDDTTEEETADETSTESGANEDETSTPSDDASEMDTDKEEVNDNLDDIDETDLRDMDTNRDDYKMFTIFFIAVLWLIFIVSIIVFRLKQNKK